MDCQVNEKPLLELRGISFFKEKLQVFNDLNFKLYSGEIHALVGDRGTGKSSLGLIMSLNEQPEDGSVLWKGRRMLYHYLKPMKNPGIQIVYQNDGLIDYFTVAENMFLPENIFRPFPFSSRKKLILLADAFIRELGFDIDPLRTFQDLSMSERVVVNILRSLYRKPELLILDEALEKLTGKDLDRVIFLLKKHAEEGMAVFCISHKIDDIYNLARKITIIRDGKILLTDSSKNIDRLNLIKMCYTQVTRNKESEDISKEFYQLLRYNEAILKNLPISLIVTDDRNHIKMINDQGQSFFNVTSEQYLNQPMSSIVTDDEALVQIQRCFNKREESSIFHQTISSIIANIKIYPIFDGTFPIGNITIIEDITDQEKMRQRVNLSENLASLGLLAAGVAHEINNPLEIIYNYLNFLRMNPDHGQTLTAVNHLEEEIDGIKLIVSNLVSFSGDRQHLCESFDINLLLSQTLTLLRPAAKDKNIICSFSSTETELFLYANKTEIRQVLLNLIKNSFEVLIFGGAIHIETERQKDKAVMRIRDNGPGVTPDIAEQVFLPFFSTKKNEGNNMGLGLPMSYGIVKKYNGDLTFRNLNDHGCEFIMTLPREDL
jgi:signal transduction histidine kinase/ABC-type branched-subunit amino acid transport system ATPase component